MRALACTPYPRTCACMYVHSHGFSFCVFQVRLQASDFFHELELLLLRVSAVLSGPKLYGARYGNSNVYGIKLKENIGDGKEEQRYKMKMEKGNNCT